LVHDYSTTFFFRRLWTTDSIGSSLSVSTLDVESDKRALIAHDAVVAASWPTVAASTPRAWDGDAATGT